MPQGFDLGNVLAVFAAHLGQRLLGKPGGDTDAKPAGREL